MRADDGNILVLGLIHTGADDLELRVQKHMAYVPVCCAEHIYQGALKTTFT